MAAVAGIDIESPDAGRSTRKAGLVLAQRVFDILRAAVFAAVVPRLLGPEDFGRFNVLVSIALYFAVLSGLGATQVMTRFVPPLRHAGDERGIARLFAGLLSIRLASGVVCALLFAIGLRRWLTDLAALTIALGAATVALRGVSNTPFALFLGLDHADRWGLGEMLRRWSSLVFLIPGVVWFGLPGAIGALVAAELLVLVVGLFWARAWLGDFALPTRESWRLYGRYNTLFFASNALAALALHGTGPLIRAVSGGYEQVAWFGAAHSAYLLGVGSAWQISMSFAPLFSSMRSAGKGREAGILAGRLLLGVGIAGVIATLAAVLIGADLVRLVLGEEFAPAAAVLPPLAIALVFAASGQLGRTLSLSWDRHKTALFAALLQITTTILAGPFLVHHLGAPGGALAVLASSGVTALYWFSQLADVAPGQGLGMGKALGLGLPFMAVALVTPDAGGGVRLVVLLLLTGGYAASLFVTRVLTRVEVAALRTLCVRRPLARR